MARSTMAMAVALAAAACGGAERGVAGAPERSCQPPEETTRALVVDWEPAERAALEGELARGIAVVRYDGCTLEILDDCRLGGEYVARESARASGGFTVRSRAELWERLPLGAPALEGAIEDGAALTLDYVTSGTADARLSSRARGMMSGRCDRATHFVRAMVRGAYAISASGDGAGDARAVRDGGDLERCRDRGTPADDPACAAVVQIVLTPVAELTASRDDLYAEAGQDAEDTAAMEEALRMIQQLADAAAGAQGEGAGPEPGGAPPAEAPVSEVARSILAVPDGGSDAWDQAVAPILIGAYDSSGSGEIDTVEEVAAIPCDVLETMDRAIKAGRGGASALRTTYGFPRHLLWVGYALGFDEKIRADADARLANCGL